MKRKNYKPTATFTADDVLERKPDWSAQQAILWMEEHGQDIEEAMIRAGNELLDDELGVIEDDDDEEPDDQQLPESICDDGSICIGSEQRP